MRSPLKIGIAGAGLLGRMLALEWRTADHTVTLFDADLPSGHDSCAMTAAGMLASITELASNDALIYRLGWDSVAKWQAWLARFQLPPLCVGNGALVVAHPNDYAELTHFITRIQRKIKEPKWQWWAQAQLQSHEPLLNHHTGAWFFPSEGHLDNQTLLLTLYQILKDRGVTWYPQLPVTEVAPHHIQTADGRTWSFDWVIDCRGRGASSTFSQLRGIRGELLWLYAPEITLSRPVRLLHPRYSLYLVPRSNHQFILGATELDVDDDSAMSVRSALELLSSIFALHPSFGQARIEKMLTRSRPTLPSHLPQIQAQTGLVAINGLYRHGFLLAPKLVEAAMQFMTNNERAPDEPSLWASDVRRPPTCSEDPEKCTGSRGKDRGMITL